LFKGEIKESFGKILYALLIAQISKEDYRDFRVFSELSKKIIDKSCENP